MTKITGFLPIFNERKTTTPFFLYIFGYDIITTSSSADFVNCKLKKMKRNWFITTAICNLRFQTAI